MADAQGQVRDDVKAALLRSDDTFRRLVTEHHELDVRIAQLSALTYLTDDQRYEESALKKRKLALKDRIEGMLRSYVTGGPAVAPS
jgi:uncharacterized protein YdcH (DUF465 family)